MRHGIESVLSGSAPRSHLRDVLEVALRGIGVPKLQAHRLAAAPLPDLQLPPVMDLLTGGEG